MLSRPRSNFRKNPTSVQDFKTGRLHFIFKLDKIARAALVTDPGTNYLDKIR